MPDAYGRKLVEEGVLTAEQVEQIIATNTAELSRAFKAVDSYAVSETEAFSQIGQAQAKRLPVIVTEFPLPN